MFEEENSWSKQRCCCCTKRTAFILFVIIFVTLVCLYTVGAMITPVCPGEFDIISMQRRTAVQGVERLNLDAYLGTWYQMYRRKSVSSVLDWGDCSFTEYSKDKHKDELIK